jgi:hypothetical protein
MKVFIKGRGEQSLSENDFLGEGGEGKVYAKSGLAYKIYSNPSKMIPAGKIKELGVLTEQKVIAPRDILLDSKNKPIGYTMRHLNNTHGLVSLFTKGFRNRNSVTNDMILNLVQDMQGTWKGVHGHGILVVDGNEMNFLVDDKFSEVYFLDVDSYQTQSYPATALMESIRDRHSPGKFTQETDWFAWGIVTFQLFIGIHPYKGTHKKLNGFDERMLANVSVLNTADVGIPPVCQPFTVIPKGLFDWYKAVFEDGKRIPPPTDYQGGAIVVITDVRHIKGTANFDIALLETLPADIWEHISVGGVRLTATTATSKTHLKDQVFGITPKMGKFVFGGIDKANLIQLRDDKDVALQLSLSADAMMNYDGRIYFRKDGKVYQIDLHDGPMGILGSTRVVANVHEKATKLFDGIAVQNLMGLAHITVFPNVNVSHTLAVKELKGKVVDAKYDGGVAMIVAVDSKGKYDRYRLRLAKDFASYDLDIVKDITYTGLNFVVIDKGICCHLNEKSEIELFAARKDDPLMKVVADPALSADMKLFKDGNSVLFARGKEMYSLKMK